jgi:hypothetical protein
MLQSPNTQRGHTINKNSSSLSIIVSDTLPSLHLAITSVIFSLLYFIICCLLPESPCYKYDCDTSRAPCHDTEKDVKLCHLWNEQDLQRKSITDLFVELRKLNLSSLIGLILVEQFIGGISILFYIKYFAQLTGECRRGVCVNECK